MNIIQELQERGVVIHAPDSVVIEDVDPARFEAGAEIFPGTTIKGTRTLVGAGAKLGLAGGGYFEDAAVGRNVQIYGGYVSGAVFLNEVVVRGHAEMRAGTVMEEESSCGHHVGFKMTVMLPASVAGSLINFCDALMAGGTSRSDHSEIGSCMAHYNYTPWNDKFASLFGDVPNGVFLRSPRIFIGGQTQIVSPVKVGFGALVPAGCAVRRNVPGGRIYGETTLAFDSAFDATKYGGLKPKLDITREYVGNLHALAAWYRHVRLPVATDDPFLTALYQRALEEVEAGIAERIKRLDKLVKKLPASLAKHEEDRAETGAPGPARRIVEHKATMETWPELRVQLSERPAVDETALAGIRDEIADWMERHGADDTLGYIKAVKALPDASVRAGAEALQAVVDSVQR